MREASVDILVTFVGRHISFRKYVVQYKLWDCRMEHGVLEAKKGVNFDTMLITRWFIFEGVQNCNV